MTTLCFPILSEAVAGKIEEIVVRIYAKDIKSEEMARVRVGNERSETAFARGTAVAYQTANRADSIAAKGKSVMHIGNQYGGRGIFD
ncbi:hypothetical protein FOCG_09483 [Fusarium oxysporum f. sp. radicis-lycopersici 26381]|nr:hypothetical protein FOCG_09483 [Fusarium oxysporum f. sp. radicis-lycopersici 26381]